MAGLTEPQGRRAAGAALVCMALALAGTAAPGQAQREANALYVVAGVGILNLEQGTGLGVPVGLTLLSTKLRILASVMPLDFGMLGQDDPRYIQFVDSYTGLAACYDRDTDAYVPYYRCSPGTDFRRSGSAELSFIPIETVYFSGKAARLHTGLGMRLKDPKTLYGTLGLFFDSPSGSSAGGVRLAMGRNFIFLGITWGMDVRRLLRAL